ncbi:conserved Plasmodium protein, unknown function [Plasmodium ovale wallikeri]|uniref:Uncharacterized protein n=2 Tax=Plasmodium ovale TaxID=36330 RepID=A0A1A8ZBU3_PLAOA|nr:conserved Plasmodium protein, unknown function [Plasmodium ovale wallikeri]SBT41274.1 conserved Plasmodium protein, unknown function [Plasmodium ovale wallikeri]SBT78115.1 conserved Plasmodium protein, unknown function [Plasmodium ovale]
MTLVKLEQGKDTKEKIIPNGVVPTTYVDFAELRKRIILKEKEIMERRKRNNAQNGHVLENSKVVYRTFDEFYKYKKNCEEHDSKAKNEALQRLNRCINGTNGGKLAQECERGNEKYSYIKFKKERQGTVKQLKEYFQKIEDEKLQKRNNDLFLRSSLRCGSVASKEKLNEDDIDYKKEISVEKIKHENKKYISQDGVNIYQSGAETYYVSNRSDDANNVIGADDDIENAVISGNEGEDEIGAENLEQEPMLIGDPNNLEVTTSMGDPNNLEVTTSMGDPNNLEVTTSMGDPNNLEVTTSMEDPNNLEGTTSMGDPNNLELTTSIGDLNNLELATSIGEWNQINAKIENMDTKEIELLYSLINEMKKNYGSDEDYISNLIEELHNSNKSYMIEKILDILKVFDQKVTSEKLQKRLEDPSHVLFPHKNENSSHDIDIEIRDSNDFPKEGISETALSSSDHADVRSGTNEHGDGENCGEKRGNTQNVLVEDEKEKQISNTISMEYKTKREVNDTGNFDWFYATMGDIYKREMNVKGEDHDNLKDDMKDYSSDGSEKGDLFLWLQNRDVENVLNEEKKNGDKDVDTLREGERKSGERKNGE